ncbi:MAG: TonB-dependent receptor [Saprospiraceae bacterium]|nr:TonB-dependent receptor [Lewinella sp.]
MKFLQKGLVLNIVLLLASFQLATAQTVLRGEVFDASSGEPLLSATILIEGTTVGTITDFDGKFELTYKEPPPFTIIVSYTGYAEQKIEVTSAAQPLKILMDEDVLTIAAVEVKGRRISEKQQQTPLTVETLDNIAIKETPAANFYDGLGALKDVDLTAASLGFKIINTRGFNSTSPVRSLQIIDGVDNQSPGLNFSLGNFLGASELDVNRVNLVVGASSAFYGPNAFNGVISMETKDPFLQKGLSVMAKGGERSLFEGGLRWADAIRNKSGQEFFAYKFNLFGFRANDWVADNEDPVYDTDTGRDNPGGYDKVNTYGDEYLPANDFSNTLSLPGLGIIHRRGYDEKDLVDYDSRNLKAGAAFHFRLKPGLAVESPEVILSSNYSTGTTVYQGDNRFSLRNIKFYQHRLELTKRDKYFLRAYVTHEDAGDSFDPYFTALLLQQNAKVGNNWRADYINYWSITVVPQLRQMEGYPRPQDYAGRPAEYRAALSSFLAQPDVRDKLFTFHQEAQGKANTGNPVDGSSDFLEPGTAAFQAEFDDITGKISFAEGGTKFYDRSALYHVHGEYMFNDLASGGSVSDLDLRIGANYRMYTPNSQGSILLDTFGRNIDTYEYGIYGGGTLELDRKLRISASLRLDKNKNFDYLFSPAASLVYMPSQNNVLRMSFSSAIRNPTLADQYLFYNVGRAILLGNLDGFKNLISIESFGDYLNTLDKNVLEYYDVDPIRPEKVKTVEVGYRTTLFEKLFLDATYYYSFYNDFIGYNLGVEAGFDPTTGIPLRVQPYRVAANATDQVTTQGFSIGFNYYFSNYYVINGNYSWNVLNTKTDDPIIPAFNTPEHKYNIGLAGRNIPINLGALQIPNFGFNINYKWIDTFIFEGSPQFTGLIPSYALLDAQINWHSAKINTTFKIGASNILNEQTFQTYGGPRIGRLAYVSVLYEFKKK